VAPPTFAVTFTMPLIEAFLRDPALGWDYSRMVHGDQTIVLHRPIRGGDELVTTIHVEDLSSRAGAHRLTLRCDIADAAGEPVATTRALLVTQAEAS
jgi:acyl-CoA thioesterase FadM